MTELKKPHIVSNQIRCTICLDEPFSSHRHHYALCKCGEVAVDGGQEYLRRAGQGYEDISIILEDDLVKTIRDEVEDAYENNRNAMGLTYAALRGIRDAGYKVVPVEGTFND